jgi:co-chaperonin GroES (HSP10)
MGEHLRPLRDKVLVTNLERGERTTAGGIVLLDDDGKMDGIRPRWAEVYAIGPDQTDVEVGQWIIVEHGRWTEGQDVALDGQDTLRLWLVDNNGILGISEDGKPDNIAVIEADKD